MYNWNSNYLIPKIFKNFIPENIFEPKLLKNFVIVSMLRNYIIKNSKINSNLSVLGHNTLIVNKYLITKPIDTKNLTLNTKKTYKDPTESLYQEYNCEIYRVVVHINNIFNPTNIKLFGGEKEVHLYCLGGDQTLHINLNLKTFFSMLTNESDLVEIKTSKENYELSNSKLSWIISKLLTTLPISHYEKDSSNNWIEEGSFEINESEKTYGSGYYFHSETDTFWKFELGDILIFYHNLWWSSILMMFYFYDLPIWGGKKDLDENTNKFRLKISVLQLFGGFSKVHMIENVQRSLKNHYVIDDNKFNEIKNFEKELVKLEGSPDNNSDYFLTSLENLKINKNNILKLTDDILKEIKQLVFEKQSEFNNEDDNFNDSDLILAQEDDSQLNPKRENFIFTQTDNLCLQESFKYFKITFKLNVILSYLLSLELTIKIIHNHIKLKLENRSFNNNYLIKLENILFEAILSYFKLVQEFNSIIENKEWQIEIPVDFPNPFNKNHEICYCDHNNKSTLIFTLLFSGYKITHNLYAASELNSFCQKKCLNSNSLLAQHKNENNCSPLKVEFTIKKNQNIFNTTFNQSKRKFSTSLIRLRGKGSINIFNNNDLLKNMRDQKKDENSEKNKNINYNKSIFSILAKIKTLTNEKYNPQEVQLKIENFWTDILKEKYNENIYNSIKDIQPKIYEIFILKNPEILKVPFPDLYLFMDDIKIYFISYSVITTYFRRTSRTAICHYVADQILFYIYKTYFDPIVKDEKKGIKNIKMKKSKIKKDFNKDDIFNSLSKTKKDKLIKLIELPKLTTENLFNSDNKDGLKKNNQDKLIEIKKHKDLMTKIILILETIINRKNLNSFQEINYKDFVEEVAFYSNPTCSFNFKKEKEKENYLNLNEKLNKDLEISIFKLKLGERFVTPFEDSNIIRNIWRNGMRNIDIVNASHLSNETLLTLDFNDELIKENIDKITNILPTNLPMLCQPNNWSKTEFGGYLNNAIEKNKLITGTGINNDHRVINLEKLHSAVNYLNSIKFKVNTEALDFIKNNKETVFKDYYQLEGSSNQDKINDNILRDFVTLEIAKTFYNIPFYLNTYADWRGRIYTNSYYLTYQGSDLSLSLLQFAEGQIVSNSGLYFLKVYGANLHDENKISRASYKDRIKWVDDNENKILSMDLDFINKADSRFAFIAFCLAYKNYKKGEKVSLPIWLDATCSGIQHFATMLKDVELARSVNVIPDPSNDGLNEKVRDIYSEMIEPTYKKIDEFVDRNPSFFKLMKVKITRKLIKPTIMTRVYNVTVKGVCNQLISNFEIINMNNNKDPNLEIGTNKINNEISLVKDNFEIENMDDEIVEDVKVFYDIIDNEGQIEESSSNNLPPLKNKVIFKAPSIDENESLYLTHSEVYHLAKIIHETLFDYYPALKKLFEYFISVCLAFTKLDIPILWFPPSGLSIEQRYLKTAQAQVSISVGHSKKKSIILKRKLDKTDWQVQTQAILPNIIHSMDASHLILILNKSKNISPVISIHDCFGCLPNNMIELENLVKLEFINLYSKNNFLEKFNSDLLNILDKNKICYEINRSENKVYIYLDKNNLPLNLNKTKKTKLEPLYFWLPPQDGDLILDQIKETNYLIT